MGIAAAGEALSTVLGIDLSSRAVDLVKLDETTNAATWQPLYLEGASAFERLRDVHDYMRAVAFDDVYLVAIEAPMSRGQPGTLAKLSRVFGAVVACIPRELEVWEVAPAAWRKELGLPGNASKDECAEAVEILGRIYLSTGLRWSQDALDAYAVAYYAREVNARGVAA